MNRTLFICLFAFVLALNSCKQSNIWEIEGFGADMDIQYDQEFMIKSQLDFITYTKYNNSLIRFAPSLTLTLSRIILISHQKNIILLGPVTLNQFGVYIQNSSNIIVRDLRILNASIYGILIYQSNQVIVDHCTILDASRTDITSGKCIDLTQNSSNVTISNNILGYTYPIQELNKFKGLLIANFKLGSVSNISLHHNLFYCNYQRSPQISTNGLFDMRQNIIFNYTQYGSRVRNSAYGNFIDNYYLGGKKDPLVFEDVLGIFSISNSWVYDCSQVRKIPDNVTHEQFIVPSITSKQKLETVKSAGCLQKLRWQTLVINQVSKFLK